MSNEKMKNFDHNSGECLQIDGADIYYEVTGKRDDSVLLVLHGGFGNIEDFNIILSGIDKEFKIIGIDSRGHGKSTLGSGELSYEQIQKDTERVLEHLNINTLSIIGFSDGGVAAYRLAAFTDLKIEKLATIGARWHFKNTESIKEVLAKVTGESWKKKFPATYEAYQKLNPEPNFDRLAENLVEMWLDPNSPGYPNEKIKNISCPLLMIRGDEDHLTSREAVFELSKLIKDAKWLNIPFAGHEAFKDQREIFMLGLNEFLSK